MRWYFPQHKELARNEHFGLSLILSLNGLGASEALALVEADGLRDAGAADDGGPAPSHGRLRPMLDPANKRPAAPLASQQRTNGEIGNLDFFFFRVEAVDDESAKCGVLGEDI